MASLPSKEEPDISLSSMNSKARFHLTSLHAFISLRYTYNISPKHGSTLNTCSNDFIHKYIEHVTSHKRENRFMSCCEV